MSKYSKSYTKRGPGREHVYGKRASTLHKANDDSYAKQWYNASSTGYHMTRERRRANEARK